MLLIQNTVRNECETYIETSVSVTVHLNFDFFSTDPTITQESITTEFFFASNINDYISDLQENLRNN